MFCIKEHKGPASGQCDLELCKGRGFTADLTSEGIFFEGFFEGNRRLFPTNLKWLNMSICPLHRYTNKQEEI